MIQQESLKRRLAKLAAPIFIETLLIMMLGAVDTVMLSRHSDNSVAAVGVVNQIIMLTFLVFEVINLGTSVLCSQYLGARLHKKVAQVVGVSILVNLAVGITVSLLLFSCARPILQLMGLTSELMQDGMDYMRIVGAFAFFQALSLTLSASLRSANKAIYPMMVTVVVNILNIIGNYSLIFGRLGFPELGVEGAAIFSWLTSNPDIIRMGATILIIDVLLEIGRPINIFATNALRAAGDVNYPFYVGLIVQWSVAVGVGYLFGFPFGWGICGMWVAFLLDENIRGFIFVHRWYGMKWVNKSFVRNCS